MIIFTNFHFFFSVFECTSPIFLAIWWQKSFSFDVVVCADDMIHIKNNYSWLHVIINCDHKSWFFFCRNGISSEHVSDFFSYISWRKTNSWNRSLGGLVKSTFYESGLDGSAERHILLKIRLSRQRTTSTWKRRRSTRKLSDPKYVISSSRLRDFPSGRLTASL